MHGTEVKQPLRSCDSNKFQNRYNDHAARRYILQRHSRTMSDTGYLKQSSQLGNLARPQVAILDFGSQYSHLIARRVRELHVYCELYSCLVTAEELGKHELTAIILSGGPNSVYEEGAPHVSPAVWKLIEERGVPVLGICYGMQVRRFPVCLEGLWSRGEHPSRLVCVAIQVKSVKP